MKCPYCGQAVADTATVCANCGGPLTPVVLPEPETPQIATPEAVASPPSPSAPVPPEYPTQRMDAPGPGPGFEDEAPHAHRPPPPSSWSAAREPPPPDTAWSPPAAPPPPPARPNSRQLAVGGLLMAALALLVSCVIVGAVVSLLSVYMPTRSASPPTPTPVALFFPTIEIPTPVQGNDPPRIPLDEFKQLYDNADTRPLIIDVRGDQTYRAGHIAGAISFPESDVDARIAELPKDKLIIAYCQ